MEAGGRPAGSGTCEAPFNAARSPPCQAVRRRRYGSMAGERSSCLPGQWWVGTALSADWMRPSRSGQYTLHGNCQDDQEISEFFFVALVIFGFLRACAEGAVMSSSRRVVVLAPKRPVRRRGTAIRSGQV